MKRYRLRSTSAARKYMGLKATLEGISDRTKLEEVAQWGIEAYRIAEALKTEKKALLDLIRAMEAGGMADATNNLAVSVLKTADGAMENLDRGIFPNDKLSVGGLGYQLSNLATAMEQVEKQ